MGKIEIKKTEEKEVTFSEIGIVSVKAVFVNGVFNTLAIKPHNKEPIFVQDINVLAYLHQTVLPFIFQVGRCAEEEDM